MWLLFYGRPLTSWSGSLQRRRNAYQCFIATSKCVKPFPRVERLGPQTFMKQKKLYSQSHRDKGTVRMRENMINATLATEVKTGRLGCVGERELMTEWFDKIWKWHHHLLNPCISPDNFWCLHYSCLQVAICYSDLRHDHWFSVLKTHLNEF